MADETVALAMVFIQGIVGSGIWGIPGVLHAKFKLKEKVRLGKLAVTFATGIAIVLITHFGGIPVPEAAYWAEALGISAFVSKWWGELEGKLGTPAPEIPPPPGTVEITLETEK